MPLGRLRPPSQGFTLLELLVSISILMILAGLSIATFPKVRQVADKTACISNLRQVGAALQMYANDHNQFLPNPLYTGQLPSYSLSNKNLAYYIAPYLGLPEATTTSQTASVMLCPGWARQPHASGDAPYRLVNNVSLPPPSGKKLYPFGYPASSTSAAAPAAPLMLIPFPLTTYVMRDYDDTNHSGSSNYLYFDWHVESVRTTE